MPYNQILCIRLDNIGDIIMTTPAFRALKETFPKSILTLLTSSQGHYITPYIPTIDNVIIYDAPWVKNDTRDHPSKMIKKLKKYSFDTAIIFTNFSQSSLPAAMLCYLADIPLRVAYCRENPYSLLTTWLTDSEPSSTIQHGVQRQLYLVETLGAKTQNTRLSLTVDEMDNKEVLSLLKENNIDIKKPIIVMHPGASEKKRQFSIDFFSQIAEKLIELDYQVILTGNSNEIQLLLHIYTYCKKKVHIFHTPSLGKFIALIKISDILLSNNTGPVHIAAAMQTPVIVFYAQTNPEHTPWQVPHKVFYFPVPKALKSKNSLLQYTFFPKPSPFTVKDVIEATVLLMGEKKNNIYQRYDSIPV